MKRRTEILFGFACAALVSFGCSSRYAQTTTTHDAGAESYSTSTTLPVNVDDEDRLAHASQKASEGKWMEAIHAYQSVYDNTGGSESDRSRALLGLGDVWANPLNPFKDFGTSLFYLDKLAAEFPESEHYSKATEKMKSVRAMMEAVEGSE